MVLNWQSTWSPYTTYQVGDVVFYLTASYISLGINTNTAPLQSSLGVYWAPFAVGATGAQGPQGVAGAASTVPGAAGAEGDTGATGAAGQGFTWRNAWSSAITYNAYDCVSYTDGNSYICIANGVVGIPPGSNIAKWNLLTNIGTIQIYRTSGSPPIPLPSPTAGARAFVSDATDITFYSVYTGGGAIIAPVWSDGVHWYIG